MLIEASTSAAAGEVTGIFDGTAELQKNWLDLIVNLFHYKCGSDEYGVDASKDGHKPLCVKTAGGAQLCILLESRASRGRPAWAPTRLLVASRSRTRLATGCRRVPSPAHVG